MKLKTVVRKNNKVQGYYIETDNGVQFISKEQLKQTMQVKGLLVEGLKLTIDGRLIESKKLRNPRDSKSPQNSKEQPKVPIEQPKQAKNKLKFQLELRKKLGITEPMVVEGIRYFILDNKVYCKCEDKSITKANILEGTEIIWRSAFRYCVDLTLVNIPNSVTEIGKFAFYGCTSLTSITISNLVSKIEESTFNSCINLTSITIPNSVTKIEDCAFKDCPNLTSITIPNSVTRLGQGAFYGCTSLTSIHISNSVTGIGDYAFSWCTRLTTVNIPKSVRNIGEVAFYDCTNLKYVYCYKGSKADNPSLYPTKVTFKYL